MLRRGSVHSTRETWAGTRDPLLQCLHLDKHLLQQQIQRNYKGLKITACTHSWGKLWTRYKKTKNPPAASEGPARDPCTQHDQGSGPPTQATPLARPTAPPLPSTHLRSSSPPTSGSEQGHRYLLSLLPAAARVPVKLCLNFSSGL